jgi:hypothetical protein
MPGRPTTRFLSSLFVLHLRGAMPFARPQSHIQKELNHIAMGRPRINMLRIGKS